MSCNELLPHFSRIFTALPYRRIGRVAIWVVATLFFVINIRISVPPYFSQKIDILAHPYALNPYISFASVLRAHASPAQATVLLQLADGMKRSVFGRQVSRNVLGVSNIQNTWGQQDQKYQELYMYWNGVVNEKTDYRDGYIMLSYLAFQMNRTEEATAWMEKAKEVDPVYFLLHD